MDHSCPHCKKELRWKMISIRPLPGVILDPMPYGANLYCPLCGGALKYNLHKYERKSILAPTIVATLLGISANQLHSIWLGLVGLVILSINVSVYVWLMRKIPATWKRYVPFQP
jgi:hypothetical protein